MAKRTRLIRAWVLDDDKLARLGEDPRPCGNPVEKPDPACGKLALACGLFVDRAPMIADREGRLYGRTAIVWRDLFGMFPGITELDVERVLDELEAGSYLHRYQVDGGFYIQLLYFERDQRPDKREARSRIPAPPEVDRGFQRTFLWAIAAEEPPGNSGEGSV